MTRKGLRTASKTTKLLLLDSLLQESNGLHTESVGEALQQGSHHLEASQCWADWDDEEGFENGANQILQQSTAVALTEPSSHLQPIGSWSSPWSTCPGPLRPGRQRPRHHGTRDPRGAGQGAAG